MAEIKCEFCIAVFSDIERFIFHTRVHKDRKCFKCAIPDCELRFKSFESFKKHLRQRHALLKSRRIFRCSLRSCDFVENSVKLMAKHVAKHLDAGNPVFCPFGCQTRKPFVTVNSMRIHNMYFHRNENVQEKFRKNSASEENAESSPFEMVESSGSFERAVSSPMDEKPIKNSETIFNIFGTLFLKLLSKNHVTERSIQEIVQALGEAAVEQNSYLLNSSTSLVNEIHLEQTSSEKYSLEDLGQKLCKFNIFDAMFGTTGIFRSPYMRKKYYRENYSFVSPNRISLQKNNEHKDSFYYYVPILDTLTAMLNDPKVYNAVFRSKPKSPGYLSDYDDGQKFKTSTFFSDKTLNIFLYQDAAEMVVNAIGNATSRYKLLCMYMVIGNLDPHLRCKTENVQLVLLCKNKDFSYFGSNCIFRRLIEDLKILEDDGILIHGGGFPERVRGSLFTTLNDNLGAHQIGGLVENFSTSSYFCRTCYIEHTSFRIDCLHTAELRTPDTHIIDVKTIENDPSSIPFRGVKAKCIFDELKYFEMFDFGAAPCVAHDLFEGWVNNDLFLILKRLSKEQHLSALYIEGRINEVCKKLKLDTKITIDFTRKSKTFKARAIDIWHIVQIIPLIFLKKTVNYEDPLMSMLMLIKNITDIITCTIVSEKQIHLLRSLITEYMEYRKTEFDTPLRPKHHFTTHYPRIIWWLGPLMSYCTLFCERKHCFFKRALRSTLNFKNVVKFCAEQHQYYQGLLGQETSRFERQFVVSKYVESYEDLPEPMKEDLKEYGLISNTALYAEEASYYGYNYKANDYLFLEHDKFGQRFYVIELQLLIFDQLSEQVTIFGKKRSVLQAPEKGLMEINSEPGTYVGRNISEFVDRVPLKSFCENNKNHLFIQHAIPLI
ncbi:uncharacterized protein LOC110676326 [Aedes aegypti]|uniref:C2H2-type domain-containing protein n=1 Tax=Aedes aegypti TaxID=7159 RepID=A0A6I8U2D5_AEDAE|nr:uncharacterized protein LOC110676326 [Aedes aegypti]